MYVLRYELCDELPRQKKDLTDNDTRRTMWNTLSPIALFVSAENVVTKTNNLVPVAIQMDYTPGSEYKRFYEVNIYLTNTFPQQSLLTLFRCTVLEKSNSLGNVLI